MRSAINPNAQIWRYGNHWSFYEPTSVEKHTDRLIWSIRRGKGRTALPQLPISRALAT